LAVDTVWHYTRNGLLISIRDKNNGNNRYGSGDLARLLFIRKARLLGFSLGYISDILRESSHGRSPCPLVRKIMAQRLQEARLRLQDMAKLLKRMEHSVALWAHMPDGMQDGNSVCQLIEAIEMED